MTNKLERLYIVTIADCVSIYHRPTYQYILSCSLGELKNELKRLLEMNKVDFYKYIIKDRGVKIRTDIKTYDNKPLDPEKEEWYQKAWKYTTEKVLREYNLTMVYEEVPYDFIRELTHKEIEWNLGGAGEETEKEGENVAKKDNKKVTGNNGSISDLDFNLSEFEELESAEETLSPAPKTQKKKKS